MGTLMQGILIGLAFWGLAFLRAPLWIFSLSAGAALLIASWTGLGAWGYVLWPLYGLYVALFHVPYCRQQYLSRYLFKQFCRALPSMSPTERDAIEAGDVWWDGELVRGSPDWNTLFAYPKPSLSQEERTFMDTKVRTLCQMLDDWEIMHNRYDLSPEAWHYLRKEGFFAMDIPKSYGGLGLSSFAQSSVITMLATRSGSAAVTAMVPNSLGPGELLCRYGTEEQKNHYLPRLASGEEVPCFGLTGPEAGSDASAIPDKGVVCRGTFDGKEVLGIRLNWNKRYITLAPIATLLGLAFKLYDPEHLIGDSEELGITVCLIPTHLPGIEIGQRHLPTGVMFLNGPTVGRDVFIPLDYIIGGPSMAGKGWRMLVECLAAGRGISLPALSTANCQLAYRTTGAYVRIRRQFNTAIGQFEGIQEVSSRIAGYNYMVESARHMTAAAVDLGIKPSVVTAIAKYHMTELSRQVINDAMDVHGGRAVMRGPHNYLAHAHACSPVSITVEGANILTRNLIIFGQGAIRCHPYVQAEMLAVANPDRGQGLLDFDKAFFAHIGYAISNVARSLALGLTGGRLAKAPEHAELAPYFRKMAWMSAGLAVMTDMAMVILGGELKRRERLSARLGDVLSALYLGSATMKYYYDSGQKPEDLPSVRWCVKTALHNAQEAFYDFTRNFPIRGVGRLMRVIIFPLGKAFAPPRDELCAEIAQQMMEPGAFRDRLTCCVYTGEDHTDPVGCMDDALEKLVLATPAERKMKEAIKLGLLSKGDTVDQQITAAVTLKVINEEEAEHLRAFEAARQQAIRVDVFPAEYFEREGKLCKEQTQGVTSTW